MPKKYIYKGNIVLSPKSDIVFKAIFGTEESKGILAAFLRDMLDLDIEDGNSLELLNTELPAYDEDGKASRLDIRVKLTSGDQIHVEIQLNDLKNTISRGMIYHSRMFASQLTRGMDYAQTKRCISLMILDFRLFRETQKWYNQFRFKEVETNEELSDLMEIIFLEMPKLADRCCQRGGLSKKEQWTLFLSTDREEDLDMLAKKDKNIEEAVKKLVYVSADEKLQFEYEMREKAEIDYYAGLKGAENRGREQGIEQGRAQGIELGREQGIELGREQGIEHGREQGIERGREQGIELGKLETARALKSKGFSDELIAEVTGLSVESIQSIGK